MNGAAAAAGEGLLTQAVNLADRMRQGRSVVEWLRTGDALGTEHLFYGAESLTIVSGHKKAGKSTLLLAVALEQMTQGMPVVYLDFENGEAIQADRLLDLGASPEVIDDWFYYIPFPRGLTVANIRNELEALAAELLSYDAGVMVIVDSFRGVFTQLSGSTAKGLSMKDWDAAEAVMAPFSAVAKTRGLSVFFIDHAKMTGSANDEYSTAWNAAKEQIADATYFLTQEEQYSVDTAGAVSLKASSDRRGKLPVGKQFWTVGGQGDGNPIVYRITGEGDVGAGARAFEDTIAWLVDRGGEPHQMGTIVDAVEHRAEHVRAAVKRAAADAGVPIWRVPGKRKDQPAYTYSPERPDDALDPEDQPAI